MKVKSLIQLAALLIPISFTAPAFSAEDASMHQVYLAAEAGKFNEAQSMMDKVLHDHPNSAKAHYVEAELLAKQGRYTGAQDELDIAERLQPSLSFTKPQALEKLKAQIAQTHSVNPSGTNHNNQQANNNGTPWGMILLMVCLISFIYLAAKWMSSRNPTLMPANDNPNNAHQQPYVNAGLTPLATQSSGGLGSTIMTGLATGAAVGAGMVAGEALMHHFTDGDHNNSGFINTAQANDEVLNQNDMGGNDFGIADNSSWDDNSGNDDWT
ncbi:tetratricopeptide repeat protein [Methylotenera versatilis]|uniref:TPR repeat-containing protein n=1 Tax=Methylotenera versatilis (strain 301) TaxID=666681 RepID=D7DK24_METV0|nr:tetratricopeptide repeat protein [Methylotenera versatilis]ADI30385.1 TPR repeat-containing protein [Methylotenera versatilis 301]